MRFVWNCKKMVKLLLLSVFLLILVGYFEELFIFNYIDSVFKIVIIVQVLMNYKKGKN